MDSPKKDTSKEIILIILVINSLILLVLLGRNLTRDSEKYLANDYFSSVRQDLVKEINQNAQTQLNTQGPTIEEGREELVLKGIIRKEEIPEDLDLGDYWHWLYFDSEFLLKDNATGVPQYIDKIQVNPPTETENYNIDDYLDKRVKLYGYLTWGYAESRVFQILSIKEL